MPCSETTTVSNREDTESADAGVTLPTDLGPLGELLERLGFDEPEEEPE